MRIGILTQYFPPEMGAPPARLYELAVRLQAAGHRVTVLTAMPNRPTGRIFDGYRGRMATTEDMGSVRVIRTWLRPNRTARALDRMACDGSFALTSVLMGAPRCGKLDVLICQNPPVVTAINGYAIARLARAKLVMWFGDIWPDILIESGQVKEGLATRVMYALQRFACSRADLVALTTPGAECQIRGRYKHVPTAVWSNGVDTDLFRPELHSEQVRAEFGASPGDFLVGYVGLLGRFQGLDAVLEAARLLADRPRVKFVMIGHGVEKRRLVAMAREMALTNLTFHDPVDRRRAASVVASLDTALAPLVCRMPGTMPSKIYEALASGVPVIAAAGCEAERLIQAHHVGKTYEPMNAADLARAVKELADTAGASSSTRTGCRELAMRFDRNVLADGVERTLVALHEGRPLPKLTW